MAFDASRAGASAALAADHTGLEVLSQEECLRLLRRARVGRVVVSTNALPAAFPVHFALLDGHPVFRTVAGSKLDAALNETVVAFEVDELDVAGCHGWSVLIQGRASVLGPSPDAARAEALLVPWRFDAAPHLVRVRSELVSGRRLPPLRLPIW